MLPAAHFLAHCATRTNFQVSWLTVYATRRIKYRMPLDYCWGILTATQVQSMTVQATKTATLVHTVMSQQKRAFNMHLRIYRHIYLRYMYIYILYI